MREERSSSDVNIDLDLGRDPHARDESRRRDNIIFRIAICGDFSARGGAGNAPTPGSSNAQAAWRVDRDDLDDALAAIAPTLQLNLGGGVMAQVRIRELDDFHPDRLFARVPQFARLRELRTRLADPATFRRAAAELSKPPASAAPATPVVRGTGSLLDAIVGETVPAPQGGGIDDSLYDFIQRAMAPYLVERTDPRQAELIAQVDVAIASAMRALLHHPSFQSLESLWRGVSRLVREVDTNEQLQVYLVDVPYDAMASDLLGAGGARESELFERLAALGRVEDGGWGVLVAHHAFGAEGGTVAVLERLANVGVALDAPWLAEATPDLALGSLPEAAATAWQTLRSSSAGRHLGLAIPRVLLRLPYGTDTDPCESFAFEELERPDAHESYLWGNPALFCATLLAQGFSERGDGLAAGSSSVITGLPLHLTKRDGAVSAKPCAEVLMGEDDAIALIESGFIPMLAYRDQDIVRVGRLQSIGHPSARLAGRFAR